MFTDWLNELEERGLLCEDYSSRIAKAKSKRQLVDLGLDANGISYLCEMQQKGCPLPYETILSEFKNFINGNYIFESEPNDNGATYTCELYCCYSSDDHVDVRTTAITFLGCVARIILNPNSVSKIYLDTNCKVEIICPPSAKSQVYLYGDAQARVVGCLENVELKKVDDNLYGK